MLRRASVTCYEAGPVAQGLREQRRDRQQLLLLLGRRSPNAALTAAALAGRVPLGRFGDPRDIAEAVAFLASNREAVDHRRRPGRQRRPLTAQGRRRSGVTQAPE
jgi:NAD(P)-dependent dehydrogenase (short-subunit alcohol dehydrogenase family)